MADQETISFQDIKRIHNLPVILLVENRSFEGLSLDFFIHNPSGEKTEFTAELLDGSPVPSGLSCSEDGVFGGTPIQGTAKSEPYTVLFIAQSESTWPLVFDAQMVIVTEAEANRLESGEMAAEFMASQPDRELWDKIAHQQLSEEELQVKRKEIFERPVTRSELNWLAERWATLTIWNVDDVSLPGTGKLLQIPNASERYSVYDFGVALVAAPNDLFDGKRSFIDAIKAARAMVHEVRHRGWTLIEFTGSTKQIEVPAWIEVQNLNVEKGAYHMEVRNLASHGEYEMFFNQFDEQKHPLTAG